MADDTSGGEPRANGATLEAYDAIVARARALLIRKNHDYGESWRAPDLDHGPDPDQGAAHQAA